jgi:hypothetical protein
MAPISGLPFPILGNQRMPIAGYYHADEAMKSDAVILLRANGIPVVKRVGVLDRMKARLRARSLDRALAAGRPSEASADVALRARRLTELSKRRELARTLKDLIARARPVPTSLAAARVPIARHAVLTYSDQLTRLVDELLTPGPVAAAGVAQVQLLVTDGTGPLYNPTSRVDLATAVERAIEALRLYRSQLAL